MFKDNFSRYEFKYPVSFDMMAKLIELLKPYAVTDSFSTSEGYYVISSLYLDNDERECFYETINGDRYRQKVRLRVYGEQGDMSRSSYLELKAKINGLVIKRRVKMILKDAMMFIDDCVANGVGVDTSKYVSTNGQILDEIKYTIVSKRMKPKIIVSYERLALNTREKSDLRITFDYNIRTREHDLDLTHGTYGDMRCPEHVAVLEIKTGNEIPYWLVKILAEYGYKNQTFSKYCSHYQEMKIDKKLLEGATPVKKIRQ